MTFEFIVLSQQTLNTDKYMYGIISYNTIFTVITTIFVFFLGVIFQKRLEQNKRKINLKSTKDHFLYLTKELPNKYIIGELFVDSTVESCVKRIKNRGAENFLDNSPIEKFQKINDSFKDYFDESNNLFYEINNRGSLAGLYQQLDKFINANIII